MAFEPGIDIGDPTVEFCSDSYIATSSKVFTLLSLELDDPTIEEYTSGSYVSEGIKVFTQFSLELDDPTIEEFAEGYVNIYEDKVYFDTAQVYVAASPVIEGDTGQLLIVGAICQFSYSIINQRPYTIQFFDETFGEVVERHWNFGDDHYSEEQNPIHIYEPGQYEVELDVKFATEKWGWCSRNLYLPVIEDTQFILMD